VLELGRAPGLAHLDVHAVARADVVLKRFLNCVSSGAAKLAAHFT
jgi:hypothetical protein